MSSADGAIPTLANEQARRLRSLDAFRGLTIAAMLIVNNPGTWEHVYPPLRHAPWHGCTPTDLIFPFFLFIVGVSIALSHRLDARRDAILKIGRRAATLILIGLALNLLSVLLRGDSTLAAWRLPGVLQRIGVCYGVVALAQVLAHSSQRRLGRWPLSIAVEASAICAVLIAYAWMLRSVAAPGSGADPLSMEGNIVAYVDRLLLGAGHMYRSGLHDPEGLLSTLPAICTTFMGLWVGRLLRGQSVGLPRIAVFSIAGVGLATCGWAWSAFPAVGVPLNKELWTSSYVVFTAGCAAVGLSLCMLVWDVWGYVATWKPAQMLLRTPEIMGRNAMVAFVGSGVLARLLGAIRIGESGVDGKATTLGRWVYERYCARSTNPELGSLLYALAMLGVWWLVLLFLERRKWYWKV